jgi:hypothetical protein
MRKISARSTTLRRGANIAKFESASHVETPAMDKAIARLNIEHYRKLLASEMEGAKRATLEKLLAEEEAKLAALTTRIERESPAAGRSASRPDAMDLTR